MAELLNPGQRVKYLYGGKWQIGKVHGVKTHEEPSGIITRVAYLIDTGKTVREDIGHEPTGKKIKHPVTGELLPEMKQVTVRQPEQVEVDQTAVRAYGST